MADPEIYKWAEWDKFSFARIDDYLSSWETHYDAIEAVFVIAPGAVDFRERFPDRWAAMRLAGLSELDLLVTGLKILLRKKSSL